MKLIPLTQGKNAIVDASDCAFLMQWKWHYAKVGYAARTMHTKMIKGKRESHGVYLHRVIMNPPKGMEIDHINGDKLDNRRCNLRFCNSSQNKHNQRPIRGGSSKYKGVTLFKNLKIKKWAAQLKTNGKTYGLGYFETQEEAAGAYNKKAIELFGNFARLNIFE